MTGFDVLDPDLDLFQNHFLEASAGTGKTFAIENIVVRLIKQGIALDRILIVTFTRAATADLRVRMRRKLAQEKLQEALFTFDEAKIFTIHGFCFHSLREYALEADMSLELEENPSNDNLRSLVKDYFRTLEGLSPKQLEKLLRRGVDPLIDSILRYAADRIPIDVGPNYALCCERLRALTCDPEELFEMAPYFAKMCNRQGELKPEIQRGLEDFVRFMRGEEVDIVDSPILLMNEKNRLKRAPKRYSSFLKKAAPLVEELSDELKILAHLCEGTRQKIEESGQLFFEDLLIKMDRKVQEEAFAEKIRSHYDCVLIDEFQDTNPIQWRIFKTLFLNKLLYLVGDPKQAIYRFRHADIYTYMNARKEFAQTDVLDTNYRSSPSVVHALNRLFAHLEITLPKTGEKIIYRPVHPDPNRQDEGGVFHLQAESERDLFAAILKRVEKPLSGSAVLVKDRYQAERFLSFATLHGFPAVSRRARSLLDSEAFIALREWLFAIFHPHDREAVLRVLGGPLYALPLEQLEENNPFLNDHHLLQERGLFALFRTWTASQGARLVAHNEALYQDLLQLVEYVAEADVALEELIPFLDQLKEELPARQNGEADAIQVLTIHVSKGLEFDTVFPIGLILPSIRRRELVCVDERYVISEEAERLHHEELDAEEMRQLYVACTRAKTRLYILSLEEGEGPINRFLVNSPFPAESVTGEEPSQPPEVAYLEITPPKEVRREYPSLVIESFSSLFDHEPSGIRAPEGGLPGGAEVGIWLHTLLEKLPFHDYQEKLSPLIKSSPLAPYHDEVYEMVERALTIPLPNLPALVAIPPEKMIKEMEFLYPHERGYMKGFIDLFFEYDDTFYLLDWKSNLLETVEELMKRNRYDEQAKIYREATVRFLKLFPNKAFGGCFYFFLRGKNQVVFL